MSFDARTPLAVTRAVRTTGANVAAARKLQGLTQALLADRAGVSLKTIARLERGDGGISLENVLRVARALGVLDGVVRATDPFETDVGRLRSTERLPSRVRPRALGGPSDA